MKNHFSTGRALGACARCTLALFVLIGGFSCTAFAQVAAPAQAPAPRSTTPSAEPENHEAKLVTSYTLPPDEYAKARRLNRIGYAAGFFSPLYEILILALILKWGWSAKFRDWAERLSKRRLAQAAIYTAILVVVVRLAQLPIGIWRHWMLRRYDLVVQGWASWLGDLVKAEALTIVVGAIAVWLLFAISRKSPRRWWFYFWLILLPAGIFLTFIAPYVIDPLFDKFEPLQSRDPALVDSLERVVSRAGLAIPPDRMFWMNASDKVKFLNAYVTGIGASKRVVVWDTTIAKMSTPQVVSVFGHEMGHYVLDHVWKGLALWALSGLLLLYVVYRLSAVILPRNAGAWKIRGPDDLAAAPALAAIALALLFVATPIRNGASRYFEHQADQYGLEVTHGITPDSGEVEAQALEILGEIDMEDPAPTRLEIWWFYDHPWVGDRIRFALSYDPWASGEAPEFVK
jgi:STE24 endopeptidase